MLFFESSSFGLAVSQRLQWSRRAKFKFPQLFGGETRCKQKKILVSRAQTHDLSGHVQSPALRLKGFDDDDEDFLLELDMGALGGTLDF